MKGYEWYAQLVKPSWAPPSWLFGPVWTFLYILIAISYGYVGYLFFTKKIPFIVVLPFILNLVFNILFTPLQFGLRNNILAIVVIYPHAKWVSYIQIPYLGWVMFATVLQITITILNM